VAVARASRASTAPIRADDGLSGRGARRRLWQMGGAILALQERPIQSVSFGNERMSVQLAGFGRRPWTA